MEECLPVTNLKGLVTSSSSSDMVKALARDTSDIFALYNLSLLSRAKRCDCEIWQHTYGVHRFRYEAVQLTKLAFFGRKCN